ncbi:MAG: hypothetical protein PSN37_04425, partial [Alphaproteobacteria bacterium]|nr:hypothetical protein [Alphaproteobacteria bacterium]
EKLLSQLRNGVDFEALSIENGESLTVTPPFKRNSSVRGLSAATIEHAFVTPLNGFAISKQKNETGRIIFQIRDIDVPRIIGDQKIEKTTSQWLKTSIRQDNFSTYIKNRQKEFNMIVNKEKLRKNLALNPAR